MKAGITKRRLTQKSIEGMRRGAMNNENRHRFTRQEAREAGRKSARIRAAKREAV